MLTKTDPNGNQWDYKYDGNGNLIEEIQPATQADPNRYSTLYEYDGADRLIKTTDANGHFATLEYDKIGQLKKTTDARGNVTEMFYDAVGNLKQIKDARGIISVTHTYDNRNNLIESVDILNKKNRTKYDKLDRPVLSYDPLNRETEFHYNTLGQLHKVVDALNHDATQTFDKDGVRDSFTDPNKNTTTLDTDKLGRTTKITTASGSTAETYYNNRGLVNETKNGRLQKRTLVYDDAGRVKTITDPDGTIEYTYDNNGNILTITENGKTISRTYDALNRVKTYTNGADETLIYKYDKVGNLSQITYPDGEKVKYGYDKNNQLETVTDWDNKVTTYHYDKLNRVDQIDRPNGTKLIREYNDAGQLTRQKDTLANGTVISEYTYSYNDAGNITEETMQPEPDPKLLIKHSMEYNKGNRLKTLDGKQPVFDSDDNMTSLPLASSTMTLDYDSRNRMVKAAGISSLYDAENNRIATQKKAANNSTLNTRYTINPEAGLSQVLVTTHDDNSLTRYLHGAGLLMLQQDGKKLYYHYDLRGSTVALTNEQGEIVDRFSYLPYGELLAHTQGNTQTPFLYNGRDGVMNDGNGLYYMRARFYSEDVRRFVNRDVVLGEIKSSLSLSRFIYVDDNPLSYIDPLGLSKRALQLPSRNPQCYSSNPPDSCYSPTKNKSTSNSTAVNAVSLAVQSQMTFLETALITEGSNSSFDLNATKALKVAGHTLSGASLAYNVYDAPNQSRGYVRTCIVEGVGIVAGAGATIGCVYTGAGAFVATACNITASEGTKAFLNHKIDNPGEIASPKEVIDKSVQDYNNWNRWADDDPVSFQRGLMCLFTGGC